MAETKTEQPEPAKQEIRRIIYPPIRYDQQWEAERHSIDTWKTNPLLDKGHIIINSYPLLLQYGHGDYMSIDEAISLADAIIKAAKELDEEYVKEAQPAQSGK